MKKNLLVLALFVLLPAASVFAVPVIDFGTGLAGIGGTIQISGGNAIGTGIHIGVLTANGTAADGVYVVSDQSDFGILNFNTNTGLIEIIGSVPSLGIADTTLLTGTITGFELTNTGAVGSITASGIDTKSPVLLAALGVPTETQFAFFGFSIGIAAGGPTGTYQAISTDIVNQAVPEPTSMLLLGSGLLALAGISRLRRK